MSGILDNPRARLVGRAVLVGLVTALTQLQASGTTIVWRSLVTAAVLAAFEVLTPLNAVVGVGKKP